MESAGHDAGHALGAAGSPVQFAEEVGIGGTSADPLPLLAGVIGPLEEVFDFFAEVIRGRRGTFREGRRGEAESLRVVGMVQRGKVLGVAVVRVGESRSSRGDRSRRLPRFVVA